MKMAVNNLIRYSKCNRKRGFFNVDYLVNYSLSIIVMLMCVKCNVWIVESFAVDSTCSETKLSFYKQGFLDVVDFPVSPVDGKNLRVCNSRSSHGQSCCTEGIETKLTAHTRETLDKSISFALSNLASLFETKATQFDEFFRDLLSKSKEDFHEMFKRTYGAIYLQNSFVFTDLFDDLESYYAKGQVDLADRLDTFFINLYQRMFAVLNNKYQFNDKYLECVSNHMKELKPFGDVPHKLSVQLKRSFVATRTFAKALSVGGDVVRSMMTIKPTMECAQAALRMQFCSGCNGHNGIKACFNFCINVMKGCLAYHADLDSEWNTYIEAMDKVSDRLLGPFNIEVVVEPINIKISEAIMNFQERGLNISERVFQGCGKPNSIIGRNRRSSDLAVNLTPIYGDVTAATSPRQQHLQIVKFYQKFRRQRRRRRATPNAKDSNVDLQFENSEFVVEPHNPDYSNDDDTNDRNRRRSGTELEMGSFDFTYENKYDDDDDDGEDDDDTRDSDDLDPNKVMLETLVNVIKQNTKTYKYFWSHWPYRHCNNDEIFEQVPGKDQHCWNGTDIGKYLPDVVGNGVAAQRMNPSVIVEGTRPVNVINTNIFKLKTISNKLKNAYNGMDVDWFDYEEQIYGSGSGSGDSIDDDDTEPDVVEEGSGGHSPGVDPNYKYGGSDTNGVNNQHPSVINTNINSNNNNKNIHISTTSQNGTSSGFDNSPGRGARPQMSLTRALITYLFPIVVVWFGGIFSDVL